MKDLLLKRFRSYKDLGDKTFAQLSDIQFLWSYNSESNSIATLVQHISENMESQWSNFLPEDFEKSKTNREIVFNKDVQSKAQLIEGWERGWAVLFRALNQIDDEFNFGRGFTATFLLCLSYRTNNLYRGNVKR